MRTIVSPTSNAIMKMITATGMMVFGVLYSAVLVAVQDKGVSELHHLVDETCQCGAAQSDGMAAALTCTKGPREFGRIKVQYRSAWDGLARSRVADLEKVVEYCLSHAISASDARDGLGQARLRADGSIPTVYWKRTLLAQLGETPSSLVRIENNRGVMRTGIIVSISAALIDLQLASRDGGGKQPIRIDEISRLWTLVVNTPAR